MHTAVSHYLNVQYLGMVLYIVHQIMNCCLGQTRFSAQIFKNFLAKSKYHPVATFSQILIITLKGTLLTQNKIY